MTIPTPFAGRSGHRPIRLSMAALVVALASPSLAGAAP